MVSEDLQFGRVCSLIVYDNSLDGLDLSLLRIKFNVKRTDTMTPNVADIRVYNVEDETARYIRDNLAPTLGQSLLVKNKGSVLLQAGYEGNFGVVFQGNIKQVILGRESATDTFVDLICGDGDRAYNYAVVNKTIATGVTFSDQAKALIDSMNSKGVTEGHLGDFPAEQLPRGKVLFGTSRDILRRISESTDKAWSIQDGKVMFVPKKSYLPGEVVVLTSKTGMIGTPQQTNEGVNVKALLNPNIQCGGRIQIDNASVERLAINLAQKGSAANIPAPLTADGVYYVMIAEHQGDTRGTPWYTTIVTLTIDPSTNPLNSVQPNFGG